MRGGEEAERTVSARETVRQVPLLIRQQDSKAKRPDEEQSIDRKKPEWKRKQDPRFCHSCVMTAKLFPSPQSNWG